MSDRPLIPDLETRTAVFDGVEMREAGGELRFEGHASVFDSWSEDLGGFKEQVLRGAFRKVLSNPATDVRFLQNHNPDLVMARSTVREGVGSLRLSEDATGLNVDAVLVPTTAARDLKQLVDAKVVTGMSYHFTMRNGGQDTWNPEFTERSIVQFGGLLDVGSVTYPAYAATDSAMRSHACGIEIIDERGTVQEDILAVVASRIHRGTMHASETERSRVDAAYARIGRLSPWMEELARRTLGLEPAVATATSTEAEETDAPLVAMGQRTTLAALNTRLIDRKFNLRGVTP